VYIKDNSVHRLPLRDSVYQDPLYNCTTERYSTKKNTLMASYNIET
jgi:hypothetical protein